MVVQLTYLLYSLNIYLILYFILLNIDTSLSLLELFGDRSQERFSKHFHSDGENIIPTCLTIVLLRKGLAEICSLSFELPATAAAALTLLFLRSNLLESLKDHAVMPAPKTNLATDIAFGLI